MTYGRERRALQILVLVGAVLPVWAGASGILIGPAAFGPRAASQDLASHFAYLSGLLMAIGIGFWSCVSGIERKTARIRLLALIVVTGGVARLAALGLHGIPGPPHLLALGMELGVTPAIALWQARLARLAD